jgi:hypothetical protein
MNGTHDVGVALGDLEERAVVEIHLRDAGLGAC